MCSLGEICITVNNKSKNWYYVRDGNPFDGVFSLTNVSFPRGVRNSISSTEPPEGDGRVDVEGIVIGGGR
jgi:hypothetical protein